VAVSQAVPSGWQDTYVAVALDPMTGQLWWAWQNKGFWYRALGP